MTQPSHFRGMESAWLTRAKELPEFPVSTWTAFHLGSRI